MNRLFSLIAMAAVVALISFSASWATSQSAWLMAVLIGSGVLATGFVKSISKRPARVNEADSGSSIPALAIRFAIGAMTLALMTISMIWFFGLTNS